MAMTNSDMLDALRRVVATSREERELAADEVTDVVRSLDQFQVELLVGALVIARLCEADIATQEAQLNALGALKERHELRTATLMPLKQLTASELPGSQAEHFAFLFEPESVG